jgi:hypothetical protein
MAMELAMRYSTWDAHPGFEFDDEIPQAKIRWHGSVVEVKARLVPRYAWTTASIDVFLDGRCVLRTGGVMKVAGSSRAEFDHDGSRNVVELSWEKVQGLEFPYVLRINDAKVALSGVPVENPELILIPVLILVTSVVIGMFIYMR